MHAQRPPCLFLTVWRRPLYLCAYMYLCNHVKICRLYLFVFFLFSGAAGCATAATVARSATTSSNDAVLAPTGEDEYSQPSTHYGKKGGDAVVSQSEQPLWEMVHLALNHHCEFDSALTIAARHHARDVLLNPSLPPAHGIDYLRFALRFNGSADYLISPLVFEPTDDGKQALLEMLGRSHADWSHCGIGVYADGGQQKAVFIGATRVLNMSPIPVQVQRNTTVTINGALIGPGCTDVAAYLELPDGHVLQLKTFVVGKQRFSVSIPFAQKGTYKFELLVTRSTGPETAVLVPIHSDVPIETRPSIFPVQDSRNQDLKQLLTSLINRIRKNMGLHSLQRDVRLDDVAQRHCKDMMASENFGHFSHRSGMLADRLHAKKIYPKMVAENIAQSSSVMRVHHNLMQSPSHKIKLLHPQYTHLGVGIVSNKERTVVTQVFASW